MFDIYFIIYIGTYNCYFNMEQEKLHNCLTKIHKLSERLQIHILQYLSNQQLQKIKQAFTITNKRYKIVQLSSILYFISNYINLTDRSMYLLFYGELDFDKIDKGKIMDIDTQQYSVFKSCESQYKSILGKIESQFSMLQNIQQMVTNLKMTTINPQLPFPKMRKEGIGMFCNSSLQFYLIDMRFNLIEPYLQECYQDLKNFFDAFQNKFMELQSKIQKQYTKLTTMRYTSQSITSANYQQLLIQQFPLQNFIAYIFAMTHNLIRSFAEYIRSFHDQFSRFIQLILRYNIFRNFVLNIQDKLAFVFEKYGEIVDNILEDEEGEEPKFCFWRPALSMWYETMKQFHQESNQIYFYILTKIRHKNLIQFCQQNDQQNEQTSPSQKDILVYFATKLKLQEFQLSFKDQISDRKERCYQLEEYFEKHEGLYQQVEKEYIEYIIDLSVNQLTVHWCGHSQHQLDQPYQLFQDQFMQYSSKYVNYLNFLSSKCHQSERILKLVLNEEVDFLNKGYVKPVTLKKIVEQCNEQIRRTTQSNLLKTTNKSYITAATTCQQDDMLCHYNYKHQIIQNKSFPLFQNLNISQKMFYSICSSPHQKILCKSTDLHIFRSKRLINSTDSVDNIANSVVNINIQCSQEYSENTQLNYDMANSTYFDQIQQLVIEKTVSLQNSQEYQQ